MYKGSEKAASNKLSTTTFRCCYDDGNSAETLDLLSPGDTLRRIASQFAFQGWLDNRRFRRFVNGPDSLHQRLKLT